MSTFFVNGKEVTVAKKQKLLRYLRDELRLTSVKDGCSEGACGACTVLIEGEPCRACIPDTERLEGKHVLTVEGLSDFEKAAFTFAFGEAGAVQCGFCIPGMVLCGKGLLDKCPDPTEAQIRFAIRNNYCRCTGYVKIVAAIRLAGQILREGKIPLPSTSDWRIGSRVHRLDVEEKVLGYGKYPDDYYLDGMCYGSAVRSKYPRARLRGIDPSAALRLPGVIGVYTAADIPGEIKVGHLKHDQYTLIPIGGLIHYLGDPLCLVVAETQEILEKAKKLVKIDYEVLPAVHNIQEAATDKELVFDEETTNVQAHKHVSRGNATEAIAKAKHVISHHFETPWTEHAFLEPECAVAYIDDDGDVFLYTTDQSSHTTLHECTMVLGDKKCKVQNALVGGGFGGKEDMSVQHHAAMLARLTGRAVKVKLSRQESLLVHPKRHHFEMDFTIGCDENGKILGNQAQLREGLLERTDEVFAGAFDPMAVPCSRLAIGHCPVALQAAEVVDTDHVKQARGGADALLPPGVAVLTHPIPVIERISPELAVLREIIGRAAGHTGRRSGLVELEQRRIRPDIAGIIGHIDRQVTDDLDSLLVDVASQSLPLLIEQVLQVGKEPTILRKRDAIGLQCARSAQANLLRPGLPRAHIIGTLERHIHGIVLDPRVCLAELAQRVGVTVAAALIGLVEQVKAHRELEAVIHAFAVGRPVDRIDLLLLEQAVPDQRVKVNKIRVSGAGAERLVRAVAVAGRADRQDLPIMLAGGLQKIRKLVRCLSHGADAIGRRQRGNMHQNTGTSHSCKHTFYQIAGITLSRRSMVNGTFSCRERTPFSMFSTRNFAARSARSSTDWCTVVSFGRK